MLEFIMIVAIMALTFCVATVFVALISGAVLKTGHKLFPKKAIESP